MSLVPPEIVGSVAIGSLMTVMCNGDTKMILMPLLSQGMQKLGCFVVALKKNYFPNSRVGESCYSRVGT